MGDSVRILRFCIVGTLNAIITATVIWIMMHKLKIDYIPSNIVAYLLAQTNNFLWCKYWVFRSEETDKFNIWEQVLFFAAAFGLAYTIQFVLLLFMVEILDINEYLATCLGFVVYGLLLYTINNKFTFRPHRVKKTDDER